MRRYSTGVMQNLSIVPTVYANTSKEEKFLPNRQQQQAPTNSIKTTRFTVWSFIPIAIFLQYKKVVVCFYTFNTIM